MKIALIILFFLFLNKINAQTDSCELQSIKVDSLIKDNVELSNAMTIYGRQQVIANCISVISFTTVIVGTLCGAPIASVVLVTGICDGATLLITGRAARKLAHRKYKDYDRNDSR